jgi:hypothetical protein
MPCQNILPPTLQAMHGNIDRISIMHQQWGPKGYAVQFRSKEEYAAAAQAKKIKLLSCNSVLF